MDSYNAFASYYDGLMEDARYAERCRYILEAAQRFDHPMGRTLDLACGTGSLTLLLRQSGVDVFGADASADMLSLAMQKCTEAGETVLFVQQEMQALTLPETVDTCVCTLDSINHMIDENDVQQAFKRISRYMNAGGLFIFDVNTVFKHREVLADNVFVMENEHVFCVWQNFPREDDIVDVALDFFAEQNGVYRRSSEDFSERAYSDALLRSMLAQAGFAVLAVCGDLRFDAPAPDEQRTIYIAQKQ